MKKHLKIFVMLMAGGSFLIPSAPSLHAVEIEQKGIRAEGLKALVGQLKQQAKKWARDELDKKAVRAMAKKIKSVTYDMKSVELLAKQLAMPGKSVKDLYVANRLVRPLLLAKTDVIRKALPAVKRAHRRLARYRAGPRLSSICQIHRGPLIPASYI